MRYLSTARILVLAFMTSLSVLNGIAEDKTNITEPHPGWLTYKTNSLEIYYAPHSVLANDGAIQKWAGKRVDAYNDIVKSLQVKNDPTVKFFVYDNNEVAKKLIGKNAGFSDFETGIIHTRVNQTVGHELTHVVSVAINGKHPQNRMLREGLAVWMDHSGRDHLEKGRLLLESDSLPTITRMVEMANAFNEECYPAAGAFVGYLLTKHGVAKFKDLWNVWANINPSCDKGFQDTYGKAQKEVEADWKAFLKSYKGSAK